MQLQPETRTDSRRGKMRGKVDGWPSLQSGFEARGWTLPQFAAQINRTDRAVEAWVYGEQKPTAAMFDRIAELLGVDVAQLMADCPKLLRERVLRQGISAAAPP